MENNFDLEERKARHLRRPIQVTFELITAVLMIVLGSLSDFDIKAIPRRTKWSKKGGKMKRKLKPVYEKALIWITVFLFVIGVSIDNFELSFTPAYLGIWVAVCLNIYVIHKFGNGLAFEEDI